VIVAEPIEQKLKTAVKEGRLNKGRDAEILAAGMQAGIITPEEENAVRIAMEARRDVIKVDDFPAFGKSAISAPE
jgi:acyl-CoA dehydrogenase